MAAPKLREPLLKFQFSLALGGKVIGYFTSVQGLGSEHDVAEFKYVDQHGKGGIHKLPGRLHWEDVTLTLGVTDSLDVWKWRDDAEDGDMKNARRHCTITMMDRKFVDVTTWDLIDAWPKKVSGPDPTADSSDYAIETMVLAHEGMKRKSV